MSIRTETEEDNGRDYVTALARGLAVMRAFSDQAQRLTLSEVARIVDLPRASVRRALFTLEKLGYVEADGRFFSLAPQVLTLAQAYLSSSPMPRVAQSFLERVSESLGQSCSLSILHEHEVIYIARSTRKRIGSLNRDVGTHLPAHCTSMGRVLLAALPEPERDHFLATATLTPYTRLTITDRKELGQAIEKAGRAGYCLVDQELEIDLRSIAIPIRNASGRVIAALNVGARASETSKKEMLDLFLPVLREAAVHMRPLLIG